MRQTFRFDTRAVFLTWVLSCDFLCARAQGEWRFLRFASVGLDGLPDAGESVRDGGRGVGSCGEPAGGGGVVEAG
jgi:hypothetical protein